MKKSKIELKSYLVYAFIFLAIMLFLFGIILGQKLYAQEYNTVNGYLGSQEINPSTHFELMPTDIRLINPEVYNVQDFSEESEEFQRGFCIGVYYGSVMRDKILKSYGKWNTVDAYDAHVRSYGSDIYLEACRDALELTRKGIFKEAPTVGMIISAVGEYKK